MNKKELRQYMREKRNALTIREQKLYSDQIAEMVLTSDLYQNLANICVYQAFRNEVSCDKITEQALLDGKQVFVPVIDNDSKTMEFYQITLDTNWVDGAYGIKEPIIDSNSKILTDKALILMPGLVFDHQKHRLGYGGGYYDKYLGLHKEHRTLALCYDFQVVEESIPYEDHDILPDYIVTEKKIL
ncbi:MAG: 5-formyltetrahydrofolate cyclo-ligase [Lachnospiraceae bacterium]|nr:5-formyltetrahydrofolate cyclo-ligase [Lachnospiraceae bacterium]